MKHLAIAALAALTLTSPAFAQAPREADAIETLCLANARDGTALPELAAKAGAVEVKSPLWPEYKNDGYSEKAFTWADAPNTFVFILTSRWTNVAPKCTVLFRKTDAASAAGATARIVALEKTIEGGIDIRLTDNGALMLIGDNSKQEALQADISLGKNRKLGEFALVSLFRNLSYKPPAPPASPAAAEPPAAPAAAPSGAPSQ